MGKPGRAIRVRPVACRAIPARQGFAGAIPAVPLTSPAREKMFHVEHPARAMFHEEHSAWAMFHVEHPNTPSPFLV
jgi:hypothetical protein